MAHACAQGVAQQEIGLSRHRQKISGPHLRNVLIADDDSLILYIFQEAFRLYAKGYNLLTAKNGEVAVKVLQDNPVDLVLTDLDMPRMNGYDLVSYIGWNHPQMKVLVMTGSREAETEKRLQCLGISQFIKKPFSVFEILSQIFSVFGDDPASSDHSGMSSVV